MNIIKNFILETGNVRQSGETRNFRVLGDIGSKFSLEIRNNALQYYSFKSKQFQDAESKLRHGEVGENGYSGRIKFPSGTSADMYSIRLIAENETNHDVYREFRNSDNSLNVNLTTGSNSKVLSRIIYRTLNTSLTINGYNLPYLAQDFTGTSTNSVIETSIDNPSSKSFFSFTITASGVKAYTVKRQPQADDMVIFRDGTFGNAVDIPGENHYPSVTTAHTAGLPTTVNGNSDDGTVTMDSDADDIAHVDDRVTGNDFLNTNVVTVTGVSDGGKTFTISRSIDGTYPSIADGIQLSFSRKMNYRWELDNVTGVVDGMRQLMGSGQFGFADIPIVRQYLTQFTVQEGEKNEYKIDNIRIPGVDTLGNTAIISYETSTPTFIKTITQAGLLTFSQQANNSLADASARIHAYGLDSMKRISGYDISTSDFKVSLSETVTRATAAVSSATFNIDSGLGIVANISTISGIGVTADSSGNAPIITAITNVGGAAFNGNTATITVNTSQVLEAGAFLTIGNSSQVATISGNLTVNKAGSNSGIMRFDMLKFLTMH